MKITDDMLTDRWLADKCAEFVPKHEPDGFDDSFNFLGFARDLRDAILAARRTTPDREAIIEECARVCDLIAQRHWYAEDKAREGCEFCAEELRLMKTAPH